MGLLARNNKMKKSGDRVYNFTLPALHTCPNAGACAAGCYARQGAYIWKNVAPKHQDNYAQSQSNHFVGMMIGDIRYNKAKRIRIHDAGDFYDKEYLNKWLSIAEACPDVEFYAYTKMVRLVKSYVLPRNMTIIYSYGGKEDHLIDPSCDRHSQVFPDSKSLAHAGYMDASNDDSLALTPNHRVGLVYHGAKSKQWGK